MGQWKKTILSIQIGLVALILGFSANITLLIPNSGIGLTLNNFEPNAALVHDNFALAGNVELDLFCGGNGTDGMSWETAHVIEDMWINPGGSNSGIILDNISRYLIIQNCYLTNAGGSPGSTGIYLNNCSNIEISGCGIEKNMGTGIRGEACDKISVINSEISDNMNDGINIYNSSGCIIRNSRILGNMGIGLQIELTEDNIVENNLVSGNLADGMELYEMNSSLIKDNTVFLNGGDGLDMWGGDSGNFNTITGNTFSNNSVNGINFDDSNHHNIIKDNEITYNLQDGFYLIDDQYNNSIYGNTISENGRHGIYIPQQDTSNNCTIEANTIHNNGDKGIKIDYNANMMIIDNVCTNNEAGLHFDSVDGGIIRGNTFAFNEEDGIYLEWSGNLSVCGNNVSFNQYGIYQDAAMGNKIWLNYLTNNTELNGEDEDPNIWDNGTVGNYWGDYTSKYPTATATGNIWNTNYTVEGPAMANDTNPLVEIDIGPVLTPSLDFNYTVNTTGNSIFCYISDQYVLTPEYTVTSGGKIIETGVWMVGDNISLNVDGLNVGTYTYEFSVQDGTVWGKNRVSIHVIVQESPTTEVPEPEPEPEPEPSRDFGALVGVFYWVGIAAVVIIVVVLRAKKR